MTSPDVLPSSTRLFSIPEVAELLSCSSMHVYRLLEAGEFAAVDIATPGSKQSKTRIRESDLAAYLTRAALH
jgi:excisionase family DNA binding protein